MYDEPFRGRAFTSAPIWLFVIALSWLFSEGVGLAAASYSASCDTYGLIYQPIFPPDVTLSTFLGIAATAWIGGLYYYGLQVAFVLAAVCLAIGSRLPGYRVEKFFAFFPALPFALAAALSGWAFAIHQIVPGYPLCGL